MSTAELSAIVGFAAMLILTLIGVIWSMLGSRISKAESALELSVADRREMTARIVGLERDREHAEKTSEHFTATMERLDEHFTAKLDRVVEVMAEQAESVAKLAGQVQVLVSRMTPPAFRLDDARFDRLEDERARSELAAMVREQNERKKEK